MRLLRRNGAELFTDCGWRWDALKARSSLLASLFSPFLNRHISTITGMRRVQMFAANGRAVAFLRVPTAVALVQSDVHSVFLQIRVWQAEEVAAA